MNIKSVVASIFSYLGFLDAYGFVRRKLTKSQVAILMYHRVSPVKDNWSLEPLSPQEFEKQIEYFCRNYEIVPLERLASCIHQGNALPERAMVITLDDGYKDNYLYAYPVLKKYHVPATIFLTTGHIGTDKLFWDGKVSYIVNNSNITQLDLDELGRFSFSSATDKHQAGLKIVEKLKKLPNEKKNALIEKLVSICGIEIPPGLAKDFILSWEEVKEMSSGGIAFGAHTVNHPILTNLPLKQAKWEITQSKRDIEERLGKEVTTFAYPNGDFNAGVVELVQKAGFSCAVSVLPGKLISLKDNPYCLSRIGAIEDFNKLKVLLCGLWGDLQGILRRGAR